MNRLAAVNRSAVTPDNLPPIRSEGPPLILFLSVYALGRRTYAEQPERHPGHCSDLDTIHVRLVPPLWMRTINSPVPLTNRDHFVHPLDVWRWNLRVWFGAIIRQRCFDLRLERKGLLAAHVKPVKCDFGFEAALFGTYPRPSSTRIRSTRTSTGSSRRAASPIRWTAPASRRCLEFCAGTTPNAQGVVRNGLEGFAVPPRDVDALAAATQRLGWHRALRPDLGRTVCQRATTVGDSDHNGEGLVAALRKSA